MWLDRSPAHCGLIHQQAVSPALALALPFSSKPPAPSLALAPLPTLTATVSSLTRFASRSATAAAEEGNPWVAPRWPELMMAAGPAAGRGVGSPNPKQAGAARAVSSRGGSTTAVGRSRPRRAELGLGLGLGLGYP